MHGLRQQLLLGVDAGGTKTTAVVATVTGHGNRNSESSSRASEHHSTATTECGAHDEFPDQLHVLGRGDAGPGNPNRCESETAFTHILDATQVACEQAGIGFADVDVAVVGVAGAGTATIQDQAAKYLQQQTGIAQLIVIPDYKLILPAAFRLGSGIAVIAGTGSIVHGVRGDTETRVGGRGYLIDDCGSGFWIGRQALRAMVYCLDGRGPKTVLTQIVGQAFHEPDTAILVAALHRSSQRLSEISSIAPLVVSAAVGGDAVAAEILDQSACELSRMIAAACDKLGYAHTEYSLALAGSVLTKTSIVREKMVAVLQQRELGPKSCQIVTEPVRGALHLGQKMAND